MAGELICRDMLLQVPRILTTRLVYTCSTLAGLTLTFRGASPATAAVNVMTADRESLLGKQRLHLAPSYSRQCQSASQPVTLSICGGRCQTDGIALHPITLHPIPSRPRAPSFLPFFGPFFAHFCLLSLLPALSPR